MVEPWVGGESGNDGHGVTRLLETVVARHPLAMTGKSGARLERVLLADGQTLVVKHVDPRLDWITRATGDTGRVGRLWSCGALARAPAVIDHAMVAVEADGPDRWLVVMRDVSASLFPDGHRLSRAEGRRIAAAAAELHAAFRGRPVPEGVAPLGELYRFLSPRVCARFASDADVPRLAVRGWELFASLVPADVVAAVARVHERPEALAELLSRHVCTLVHGDLKLANLGFLGERVVVLDWGSLTSWAPAAVDFAWFLAVNGACIDATHDELVDDVCRATGGDHDDEALRLALLGGLAQLGWEKALGATDAPDETVRRREREGLVWWSARAREGIEVWGSG
ncbi:MAG TPA: hypothetical protein VKP64_04030 [Mycobacteriales bacterium]|nr:hypothetical protein [Mycobacteriales bacterium]